MSNFPIIPTTPPPLDLNQNENEEEEELEFGTFNNISPEEEKDIDFVVPDYKAFSDQKPDTNHNEINDSINCEDKSEDISHSSDDNTISDNRTASDTKSLDIDSNGLSEEVIERVETEEPFVERIDNNINDNNLDSQLNPTEDKRSDDRIEELTEDNKVQNDNSITNNKIDVLGDELDFGDFASFDVIGNQNDFNSHINHNSEENKSNDFNTTDISFNDFKPDFDYKLDSQTNQSTDNLSDDDFADFASAQPVLNSDVRAVPEAVQSISNQIGSDDFGDDEFADFSSFQEKSETNFTDYSNFVSITGPSDPSDKLSQLFADVFPIEEPIGSVENAENISKDLFNGSDQNSKNLWKNLKDLENASSLKVKWTTSHCFQLLLTALNIDPRNILRNTSVPMYASGLGCVLEPTKHQTNDDFNDDIESDIQSASTIGSIPPVQFDWSSSGLTNPLDINQKSMAAFDLDFFVTNDDVKNTNRHSGISNFEELLNDQNEDNSTKDLSSFESHNNSNNLMQQILSTVNTTSMSRTGGSQVLSAEALQVLQELPDLSFMRAKVLMFPLINMKTSSAPDD